VNNCLFVAHRCQNLKYLTLDFSNAMQLHDFNDMNSFPCNLRSLTICLSEVIFMEGFMRKVYQHLSSLEVLHLIGFIKVHYTLQVVGLFINITNVKNWSLYIMLMAIDHKPQKIIKR